MRYSRIILVALLAAAAAAPAARAGATRFGLKAGITVTNAYDVAEGWDDALDWRTGLTAGIFVNHAINENLSIQPELLYTQKGFGSTLLDEGDWFESDVILSLDYFELPVLAKYSFSPGKRLRPMIYAGPGFAYCFGSDLELTAWILSGTVDFSSVTHTTDFLGIVGTGFDYVMDKGTITLDARFTWGFTNVIVSGDFEIDGSTETIDEDDFKDYGLSVMLGYTF